MKTKQYSLRIAALMFVTALLPTMVAAQTTLYVDDDNCPGPGTGILVDPFCNIQDAINVAIDTDTVLVLPGTYNELIDFLGKAITLRSSGGRDVTIIDAAPVADPGTGKPVVRCDSGEGPATVLDGFTVTGGTGNLGLFGGGMFINNSSPTVTNSHFTNNILPLNLGSGGGGMYIGNGSPNVNACLFSENQALGGGGMFSDNSSPTIATCEFSQNSAVNGGGWLSVLSSSTVTDCVFNVNIATEGGGMFIAQSGTTVTNCLFSGNSALGNGGITGNGGGVRNSSSNPTITGCTFSGNTATNDGGGMRNDTNSNPTVTNCVFSDNTATMTGGGMHNASGSSPIVTGCTFSGNDAGGGGGMYNIGSTPAVTESTFTGNSAFIGGGMLNDVGSHATVTNCMFSGNRQVAVGGGGGLTNNAGGATLTNCTFSGNTAEGIGGGIDNAQNSTMTLFNCILWGNFANGSGNELINFNQAASPPTITFSDIQGSMAGGIWDSSLGIDGGGNIDADPLIVDSDGADNTVGTVDDDLRISPGSPCIDAGDNSVVDDCQLDLDGNLRRQDDPATTDTGNGIAPVVDMGAYEFGSSPPQDCNGNGIPDECEIDVNSTAPGGPFYCTSSCDPDCNNNGGLDACDISSGSSADRNANGIPDECDVIVVDSLADPGISSDGLTTFREAITSANNGGGYTILFDPVLAGGTIQPLSQLPDVSGGYITINGDIDNNDTPDIELDGSLAGIADGIRLHSAGNFVIGLVINRFEVIGIRLWSPTAVGNTISFCYVGTNAQGNLARPNSSVGIWMQQNTSANQVGPGNVISGNMAGGIAIDGGAGHAVFENKIGVDRLATHAIPNGNGVWIRSGITNTIIGPGNTISGNTYEGILVSGAASSNQIVQNIIGTDDAGSTVIPNGRNGIVIGEGSFSNTIGPGNVISGNVGSGVQISDGGSIGNIVAGNFIGTSADGSSALPNESMGIIILGGAADNAIGPQNVISGNTIDGVHIRDVGSDRNVVTGNLIGLDATGMNPLGNLRNGVAIFLGAATNIVGGLAFEDRNVISANDRGIIIAEGIGATPTSNNIILGNFIGLDSSGMRAVGNHSHGVLIVGPPPGAAGNQIGPSNVISGNDSVGVGLSDPDTVNNTIFGNMIGTDATGGADLGNGRDGIFVKDGASGNTIGPNNIISNNIREGVRIEGVASVSNTITHNSISMNTGLGIIIVGLGNGGIQPPLLLAKVDDTLFGETSSPDGSTVEVFIDAEDEGASFLASATVTSGTFVATGLVGTGGQNITATITDPSGNTSEFSAPVNCFGTSTDPDSDGNGIPDQCEPVRDCNANGIDDVLEIAGAGTATIFAEGMNAPEDIVSSQGSYPSGFYVSDTFDNVIYQVSPLGGTVAAFAPTIFAAIGATFAPDEFGQLGPRLFATFGNFPADGPSVHLIHPDGTVEPFADLASGASSNGIAYLPQSLGGFAAGKLLVTSQQNTNGKHSGSIHLVSEDGVVTTLISSLGNSIFTPTLAPSDFGKFSNHIFFGSNGGSQIFAFDLTTNDLTIFATAPLPMSARPGLRQIAFSPVGWAASIDSSLAGERVLLVSVASGGFSPLPGVGFVSAWDQRGKMIATLLPQLETPGFEPRGMLFVKNDLLISDIFDGHGWLVRATIDDFGLSDCDGDGTPDECAIASGSVDCNSNAVPDECEIDCNGNGVADQCDVQGGVVTDCNGNFIPDSCEQPDCNSNGFPDDCDLADGTSRDLNRNQIPDECDRFVGDFDDDKDTDLDDYAILESCLEFSGPDVAPILGACLAVFDFDTDDDVDMKDVCIFQQAFTGRP